MFAWQCILHKGYVYLIISGGLNTEYIWKNQFLRTLSWKMKFKQDLPEMQQNNERHLKTTETVYPIQVQITAAQ